MFKEITDSRVRGHAPFFRSYVGTATSITRFLCAGFAGFGGTCYRVDSGDPKRRSGESRKNGAGIYIAVKSDAIVVKGNCCGKKQVLFGREHQLTKMVSRYCQKEKSKWKARQWKVSRMRQLT